MTRVPALRRPPRIRLAATLLAVAAAAGTGAGASTPAPPDRPGRFVMTPTEGGFMRLDTETGSMSLCTRRSDQWSCQPIEDQARAEREAMDKLKAENAELRRTIRQLEEMVVGLEKPEDRQAGKPSIRLPTEKEVDEGLDYVERMFKKFRDRLKQLEGGEKATPL